MHEDGIDFVEVVDRAIVVTAPSDAFGEHGLHGVVGRIDVATRRVATVEHRQVLNLAIVTGRLVEAREGLAEVRRPVLRVAAGYRQIDLEERGVAVHQHRHRTGTLGRLTARPDRVLGNIGADHDRQSACAIRGQVAQCSLEAVNAPQAGVLELRHLAVPGQLGTTVREKRIVDHALDDDGAGGVVAARFGAEGEHPDPRRVDVVVADKAPDRVGGKRVNALARAAHPEGSSDHTLNPAPWFAVPLSPVFETHAVLRKVQRQAAYSRHQ